MAIRVGKLKILVEAEAVLGRWELSCRIPTLWRGAHWRVDIGMLSARFFVGIGIERVEAPRWVYENTILVKEFAGPRLNRTSEQENKALPRIPGRDSTTRCVKLAEQWYVVRFKHGANAGEYVANLISLLTLCHLRVGLFTFLLVVLEIEELTGDLFRFFEIELGRKRILLDLLVLFRPNRNFTLTSNLDYHCMRYFLWVIKFIEQMVTCIRVTIYLSSYGVRKKRSLPLLHSLRDSHSL